MTITITSARGFCRGCRSPLKPSKSRPRKWCSGRCRKRTLYGGECVQCGAPTDGGRGPGKAPLRCRACCSVWTEAAIIDAICRWAAGHDGVPPRSLDWCPPVPPGYPSAETVSRVFGTFNAGVRAAGFKPRRTCDRHRYDALDLDALAKRLRAGEPVAVIAAEFGATEQAFRVALRARGFSVRDARRRAA